MKDKEREDRKIKEGGETLISKFLSEKIV